MPITSDYHLHSSFSGDSNTPMEDMILRGIELGLKKICFTEHMDFDYPATAKTPENYFVVNTDSYLYDLIRLRDKYAGQIVVNFGIELGLQPHLTKENAKYVKTYDFDFVIASLHICNRKDPYLPAFFESRPDKEGYREYFAAALDNIRKFTNFDVFGHLDYVVRVGMNKDNDYFYDDYRDILDELLTALVNADKGLEVNTGAISYGLRELNPSNAIIKRFRELGGEIITIGSDAHTGPDMTRGFDRAATVLKDCGFKYYAVFDKRVASFISIY
ncbi:MAG: histidinol-phosphatase HisJ family protein [Lachnospiraceae bacterium]|nr:histidinol-phosphatase HisJ family protein [Lachnospiraceae bacterium]